MKLLDAILPPAPAQRLSVGEWLSQTAAVYSAGGTTYTLPYQTTMPGQKAERIETSFEGYVLGGLQSNGVIFNLASVRGRIFSEARLMWQAFNKGRPGDLFSTPDLGAFEQPWPGGTFGDLLTKLLLHSDFGGNAYVVAAEGGFELLRPDWVDILLGDRHLPTGEIIGRSKVGYHYFPNGDRDKLPTVLSADEVAHFAPQPDPIASFRGMSWLTPVLRELQADGAATSHKLAFFENAATPNLAVSLAKEITPEQFEQFVETMDAKHKGVKDAYKTLYTGGGADVSVIGANMQQLDFKVTQGAGETRLAAAAGVPPVVANLSEGMQGSTLNQGNFAAARRQFGDTLSALWRNMTGSLQILTNPPQGSRLWYDARDIPFLREDQRDAADILSTRSISMRQLIEAGFEPGSVINAINGEDLTLLKHTGLFSIQLQEAGSPRLPESPAATGTADKPGTPDGTVSTDTKTLAVPAVSQNRAEAFDELLRMVTPNVNVEIRNEMPALPEPQEQAEPPAPIVNVTVEAPNVQVDNHVPVPSVQVAAPNVTNEVHLPPEEKVTRRVVRDAAGNITKVVEE